MKRSLDVGVLMALLVAFLALNLLLLGRAARAVRRTEIVPVPSTWRTTPSGTRAAYTLLERLHVPVGRLLTPLTRPLPPDMSVLVMLEPGITVTAPEADVLRAWVESGGTLVLACTGPAGTNAPVRYLPQRLFARDPSLGQERLARARAAKLPMGPDGVLRWELPPAGGYLAGVRRLELDPRASALPSLERLREAAARLTDERRELVLAGEPAAPLATLTPVSRGQILFVAGDAWFANGQLARADNAVFVTNLVAGSRGRGRVVFDEYHLGNLGADSLAALLWRPGLRWLTLQLLLAGLLWALRTATRFGPARAEPAASPRRPATDYVRSLAGLYQRAHARDEARRLWYEAARREWLAAAGLSPEADDARLVARLRARMGGWADEVARVLARLREPLADDRELLALARETDALLRVTRRREQA